MLDRSVFIAKLLAAVGCGLMAGVYLPFSTFLMRALTRLPPAQGMAAMQSINATIVSGGRLHPAFATPFAGTALLCVALIIYALTRGRQEPHALLLLAGGVLYLVGHIVVTGLGNVPLNEALAVVDPTSTEGTRLWADYQVRWTLWNTVRTVACLASALAFSLSLRA
ncbi:DUF1772 domain-containing protein [Myxococcaceae bacterium JPH2]|nr:DUF1772 domain-containing protein [Myxococcaceae bacterium JPH2]